MNKYRAKELSTKLETVLAQFAEENDLNLKYKGSSYGDAVGAAWKPRFEFHDITGISEDSSFEKENFINNTRRTFGQIRPEWYGAEVKLLSGRIGILTEYHPRKSKYPMIISTPEDGKKYKMSISMFIDRKIS